jgi:hypothetical protein
MKPSIKFKSASVLLILLTLGWLPLCPMVRAVLPPPDGGYPEVTRPKGNKLF